MPVGGIKGMVRINTSNVASDLKAVWTALKAVDEILGQVTGKASTFANSF